MFFFFFLSWEPRLGWEVPIWQAAVFHFLFSGSFIGPTLTVRRPRGPPIHTTARLLRLVFFTFVIKIYSTAMYHKNPPPRPLTDSTEQKKSSRSPTCSSTTLTRHSDDSGTAVPFAGALLAGHRGVSCCPPHAHAHTHTHSKGMLDGKSDVPEHENKYTHTHTYSPTVSSRVKYVEKGQSVFFFVFGLLSLVCDAPYRNTLGAAPYHTNTTKTE